MNMEERENNILEIRGLTKHYSDFTPPGSEPGTAIRLHYGADG